MIRYSNLWKIFIFFVHALGGCVSVDESGIARANSESSSADVSTGAYTGTDTGSDSLAPVSVILIDDHVATHYGTYFNVNQRVVKTKYGLFLSYLRTYTDGGAAGISTNEWILMRSIDNGETFKQAFRNFSTGDRTVLGKAPELAVDDEGNLYLATVMGDQKAYVYKLVPPSFNTSSYVQRIPYGGYAPKFSFHYDRIHDRLVLMTAAYLLLLDKDTGAVIDDNNYQMLAPGTYAYPQYAFLATNPNGDLYAAWHTARNESDYYYDIHCAYAPSSEGHTVWRNPFNGNKIGRKGEPIICDSTGPAPMVNLASALSKDGSRTNGLNSFYYKNQSLHFLYGGKQDDDTCNLARYVKYAWPPFGEAKRLAEPNLKGTEISIDGSDGFFCSEDEGADTPLFLVSYTGNCIVALRSDDNGTTWTDHARSDYTSTPHAIYSIAGSRKVVDGFIYGAFTENHEAAPHKVYFLRIPAD